MTLNVRQIAWLDSYHRDVRAALLPLLHVDGDGDGNGDGDGDGEECACP